MQIRSAVEADEPAIVALWQACGLTAPYNDPVRDFRFARGKPASDVLAAFDETDQLIGTVMVGHDGHRGWLYYVAVAPGQRRRGVGRALIRAAEQWLAARDVLKAQLMVRETNAAVAKFYDRIGYGPMPRILMEKWLRDPDGGRPA